MSYEAMLEEIGIPSKNLKNFCDNNGENSCKKVINSNNFVSDYLSISKTSFIFFSFQFLFLIISLSANLGPENLYILTILHFASLPIVCISIYYQRFIVKEFCKICLLISTVLIAQVFCSSYVFFIKDIVNFQNVKIVSLIILLVTLILALLLGELFYEYLKNKMKILNDGIVNLKIRKNVKLFKLALNDSKYYKEFSKAASLNFESNSSNLDILVVISPTCGHCKDTIGLLYKIWNESNKGFNLRINFNIDMNKSTSELLEIHLLLVNIFGTNSHDYFIKCILDWYNQRDISILKRCDIYKRDIDLIYTILNNQFQWNYSNNIFNTPKIIINGYEYPEYYERNELGFYIFDLIEMFELE